MNKSEENNRRPAFLDRTQLKDSKRVVIKMGSAVITREDGKGCKSICIYYKHYILIATNFWTSQIFEKVKQLD